MMYHIKIYFIRNSKEKKCLKINFYYKNKLIINNSYKIIYNISEYYYKKKITKIFKNSFNYSENISFTKEFKFD